MEPINNNDLTKEFFLVHNSSKEALDETIENLHKKMDQISKLAAEYRISDFAPKSKPGWGGWVFSYMGYGTTKEVKMPVDIQIQNMAMDLLSIIADAERLSGNGVEEYKKILSHIEKVEMELIKLLGPDQFLDRLYHELESMGNEEGVARIEKLRENLQGYVLQNLQSKINRLSRTILSTNPSKGSDGPFLSESSAEPLEMSEGRRDMSSQSSSSSVGEEFAAEESVNPDAPPPPPPPPGAMGVPPPPPPPGGIGVPPPPPPGMKQAAKPKVDPEVAHLNREKLRLEKALQMRCDPTKWVYLAPPTGKMKEILENKKEAFETAKRVMGESDTSKIDELIEGIRSQMDGKITVIGPNNLNEITANLSKLTSDELKILMHFASNVIKKRYQGETIPENFFATRIQREFHPENERQVELLRSSEEDSPKAFFQKEMEWTKYIQESLLADTIYKEAFQLIRDRIRNPAREPKYAIKPFKGAGKSDEGETVSMDRSKIFEEITSARQLRSTPKTEKRVVENPLEALRKGLKSSTRESEAGKGPARAGSESSSSTDVGARLRRTGGDQERLEKLKKDETIQFFRDKFTKLNLRIGDLMREKADLTEQLAMQAMLPPDQIEKLKKRLAELNETISDYENGKIAFENQFNVQPGTEAGVRTEAFMKKMSSLVNESGANELEKHLERSMKLYER